MNITDTWLVGGGKQLGFFSSERSKWLLLTMGSNDSPIFSNKTPIIFLSLAVPLQWNSVCHCFYTLPIISLCTHFQETYLMKHMSKHTVVEHLVNHQSPQRTDSPSIPIRISLIWAGRGRWDPAGRSSLTGGPCTGGPCTSGRLH